MLCSAAEARGALREAAVPDEGSVSWGWLCLVCRSSTRWSWLCVSAAGRSSTTWRCVRRAAVRGEARVAAGTSAARRAEPLLAPPFFLPAPLGSRRQRLVGRGAAGGDVVPPAGTWCHRRGCGAERPEPLRGRGLRCPLCRLRCALGRAGGSAAAFQRSRGSPARLMIEPP